MRSEAGGATERNFSEKSSRTLYGLASFTILASIIDSGVILFVSGYVLASSCKIVSIPLTGG